MKKKKKTLRKYFIYQHTWRIIGRLEDVHHLGVEEEHILSMKNNKLIYIYVHTVVWKSLILSRIIQSQTTNQSRIIQTGAVIKLHHVK